MVIKTNQISYSTLENLLDHQKPAADMAGSSPTKVAAQTNLRKLNTKVRDICNVLDLASS